MPPGSRVRHAGRLGAIGIGIGIVIGSGLLVGSPAAARDRDWVGVEKCRTCHEKQLMGDQVAAWRSGPHRHAYATLKSPASLAIAAEQGLDRPPAESDACLGCHLSAHGVPPVRVAHPLGREDGVQCETCHGPGRDYRKKKIMSDRKLATRKGLRDADDEALCIGCHNASSPTFDPNRYQLPDGSRAGFDFATAKERIAHPIPADVKGRFVELEDAQEAAEEAAEADR